MGLDYLKVKLLDYRDQWPDLVKADNPFAIVVMAHLKALETRQDHSLRKHWKTKLTRMLYERGYTRQEVMDLYRFIDWAITLPPALELEFLEDLSAFEKEKKMPYISTVERIARQKGRQERRQETVLDVIRKARQQGVAISTIASIVGLDIKTVNRILSEETMAVPLHLLDANDR